ncbi:MAG: transglycosylase SLT domain-containing protein [Cardiobacteriaceae bacterium]|nr:transglycosylase SLT domain-containing protein [Cardiobacteriaceae bacterium]
MNKILLSLIFSSFGSISNSYAEENILDAEAAIKNGAPLSAYQHLAPHPLYPYLEYRAYSNNLESTPTATIVNFLQRYPSDPFSTALANKAFPNWLSQGNNDAIIAAYSPDYADEKLQCQYRLALLNTGKTGEAAQIDDTLWQSDKSLNADCNALFDRLAHQGQIDKTHISTRFMLAMDNNNALIASYLAGGLTGSAAQAAQTWMDIDQNRLPIEAAYSLNDPDWRSALLAQQFNKRLKKDPSVILAQASNAAALGYISRPKDAGKIYNRLLRLLADNDDPHTLTIWEAIPAGEHEDNTIFDLIAYDLRRQDWRGLYNHLNKLGAEAQEKGEIQYWLGKAAEKNGDRAAADNHYRRAASKRDFFGFLAAEKLGQAPQFNDHPIRRDQHYASVVGRPAAYRARIWRNIGDNNRANQEWQALLKNLTPAENAQAALYASEIGWTIQAVTTLSKGKNWDALAQRFPTAYEDRIIQLASRHGISPAKIFAIIRKESIFQPAIASKAGAVGLMQVMPATASATAQRNGIPYSGKWQLTEPETNLEIGSQYLADRLNEFGHLAYAAAAYNAGPSRVYQWRNDYPGLPLDEWIAQIPFNETRDYVKRVLEYEKVYEYRLGLPITSYSSGGIRLW